MNSHLRTQMIMYLANRNDRRNATVVRVHIAILINIRLVRTWWESIEDDIINGLAGGCKEFRRWRGRAGTTVFFDCVSRSIGSLNFFRASRQHAHYSRHQLS